MFYKNKDQMKNIAAKSKWAVIISFFVVLPFAILDFLFNPRSQNLIDSIVLFGLLWLLSMAFIAILVPMVRTIRAGNNIMANPTNLLFRVAFLTLIAMVSIGILIDQFPCFIGVPNCD